MTEQASDHQCGHSKDETEQTDLLEELDDLTDKVASEESDSITCWIRADIWMPKLLI